MANAESEKVANGAKHVERVVRDGMDRAKDVASTVGGSMREFADSAKRVGSAVVNEVSNVSGSTYEQVKGTAHKAIEQLSDKSREGVKIIQEEIHRYPFTSLITAFSIGALCGMMFRRH